VTSQLDGLKRHSVIVADTGDIESIVRFKPQDATTNPSLIFKSAQDARYRPIIDEAIAAASAGTDAEARLSEVIDHLFVGFGRRILELIPGRVSTEVDARLSFDTGATEAKARRLIELYESARVSRDRVLIKIASTWEGIRAAERLERDGHHCNLTLLFSFAQAVACGDAGVRLISPFVGRIYDWHKKAAGASWDEAANAGANDPGVRSVRAIFNHYKHHGIQTEVMGASFRNVGQITALAGCDLLTISPELLAALQVSDAPVPQALDAARALALELPAVHHDERSFRWAMNEDAMATEKLAEGIRAFAADAARLDQLIEGARA